MEGSQRVEISILAPTSSGLHSPLARAFARESRGEIDRILHSHSTNQFLRSRSRLAKSDLFVRHSTERTSISLPRMNRIKYTLAINLRSREYARRMLLR